MTKLLTQIIVASTLFLGCGPHKICKDTHINPVFIGFAISDIDTIVLKAYTENDNYNNLVNTITVSNQGASIYTTSNDTTVVYVNDSDPDQWISPGYDWQLYIPSLNRTISISAIKRAQVDGRATVCYNPIYSFHQDGQLMMPELVETGQFFTSGFMAYIPH